jgi:SAM-dependent methyltransferase
MDAPKPVCDLCGSTHYKTVYKLDTYNILRCRSCGLVYRYPMPTPEQLYIMYNQPRDVTPEEITAYYRAFRRKTYRRVLAKLASVAPQVVGALTLDLGTGHGWSYEALTAQGYSPVGLDLNLEDLRDAVKDGPTVQGWGEALPFADGTFPVIISTDVLEHATQPRNILAEVRRVLAVDGIFIARVPDVNSVMLRTMDIACAIPFIPYRQRVPQILYRLHVYGFSRKTLVRYFNESNLEIIAYYREGSKNLDEIKQKRWARNPLVRWGIATLTHLGEFTGRKDEIIVFARHTASAAAKPSGMQPEFS